MSSADLTPVHVVARRQARDARLLDLGYDDYPSYLLSDHWQNLRARYRTSSQPQECFCGEAKVDLHHKTYERIGAERLDDLEPLCRRCHQMVHVLEAQGSIGLDMSGLELDPERAAQNRQLEAERTRRLALEALNLKAERRAAFDGMTPGERLDFLHQRANKARIDTRSSLRLIEKKMRELYDRLERLQ